VDNVIKSATAKICPTTMFGKKSFLLTNQNVKRHQQKALIILKANLRKPLPASVISKIPR
jgi:hypothetical protein